MPLKKWPLLDKNSGICSGSIRVDGTRLTTEHVYDWCAGSDSEDHIKAFQREWPYVSAEAIQQAIAFDRKRRHL